MNADAVASRVLDTIGTFRMGALIKTDDVRFASYVDGLDLSDVDPKQLTAIMKQRCEPHKQPARRSTLWTRRW